MRAFEASRNCSSATANCARGIPGAGANRFRCFLPTMAAFLFAVALPGHAQTTGTTTSSIKTSSMHPGIAMAMFGQHSDSLETLTAAAEDGDAAAMAALATVHYMGIGVPADFTLALKWAGEAAAKGTAEGLRLSGLMSMQGHGTPRNAVAAVASFRQALESGDEWSRYLLARLLEGGAPGIVPSPEEAVRHYELAAAQGHPYSEWRLGELLIAGVGVPRDLRRGIDSLRSAADAGVIPAQRALANQTYKGEGTVQNYQDALARYTDAALLGDADAQNMAGYMFQRGLGTAQPDMKQAVSLFQRAAAQGHAAGLFNLAQLFRDGIGVEANLAVAHALFNLAGARGLEAAAGQRALVEKRLNGKSILMAQRFAENWRTDWSLKDMRVTGSGSGFFISLGGALVTNHHVVHGCDEVGLRLGKQRRAARVAFAVEASDLAVVHMIPKAGEQSTFNISRIAADDNVVLGERVTVFGWPLTGRLSDDGVLTSGTISAFQGLGNDPTFLQLSAQIQPGNSGGSVLGETGHVVGVISRTYTGGKSPQVVPQNVNFAVKHTVLAKLLRRHGQKHYRGSSAQVTVLRTRDLARIGQGISAQVLCYRYDFSGKK